MVSLILAACLTACKGKTHDPRVETIAGVTHIQNPATPLHPARTVIFEEELTYEETDQAGGKMSLMDEDETTGTRRLKRFLIAWKES
jgi:hypothetical protein